jgi:hypothetical protein
MHISDNSKKVPAGNVEAACQVPISGKRFDTVIALNEGFVLLSGLQEHSYWSLVACATSCTVLKDWITRPVHQLSKRFCYESML